jgi:small ligand-binding sensory domain FIST
MIETFQWLNAFSTCPSLEGAIADVVEQLRGSLSKSPDLGIVFISSAYASEYPRLVPLLREALPMGCLIGCGGGGVIGTDADGHAQEVEQNPALSLCVGVFSGVTVHPFYLPAAQLPDPDSPPQAWVECVGVDPQTQPDFILLADPMQANITDVLEGLDFAYPAAVKLGGLASAGMMGVPNGLFFDAPQAPDLGLLREGTVGVALSGKIRLDTIVAQGCRPIGEVYRVEAGDRNILLQLSTQDASTIRAPLDLLRDLIESLAESDRTLAQNSLFIGVVRDVFKRELGRGDFLIRNLLGVDPKQGAIAIGDRVRIGQRIQFHLRDAKTSADDLEGHLQEHLARSPQVAPAGALLFSCLGRGEGLYGQANFDSQLFQRYFGTIPIGGFFCNGEIGPVGKTTFLHGYTSVFGLIRPTP